MIFFSISIYASCLLAIMPKEYLSTRISFLSDISKYTTRIAKTFVLLKMFESVDGWNFSQGLFFLLLLKYYYVYILHVFLNRE